MRAAQCDAMWVRDGFSTDYDVQLMSVTSMMMTTEQGSQRS